MAKALFLSHVPLFPIIGGDRIRIVQSLKLLVELYDTDILYMTNSVENESVKDYIKNIGNETYFYSPKIKRYVRALKTIFNRRPFIQNLYRNKELERQIREIYNKYDLVFCASPAVAQYVRNLSGTRKVLDMTDSLTMNYSNALAGRRGIFRFLLKKDLKRMKRYERECKSSFDSVAYISEIDKGYVDSGNNEAALHVVGNMVLPYEGTKSKCDPEAKHIIFVGKMDYEPNVQGVLFFAKKILPILRERDKNIRFSIVGSSPKRNIRNLGLLPGVTVTGFVESLDDWFENASLFVAPMLSGSGVQNKILQALAHGCGVITTPLGREGIEMLDEVIEVVDPDPILWADRIKCFFENPAPIQEKALKAPMLIQQEFGMPKIRTQFRNFV